MPTPELTRLVEQYDSEDPEERIEVCRQMRDLADPEAIQFLVLIYQEDSEEKVKKAAAEALGQYRAMQLEIEGKRRSSGRGMRRARTFLIVTLVVLVALNVMLVVAGGGSEEEGLTEEQRLANQIATSLNDVILDAQHMRGEIWAIQAGRKTPAEACRLELNRPEPVQLDETQAEAYPEISDFVSNPAGDYQFVMTGMPDVAYTPWDTVICAGTTPVGDTLNAELQATAERLGVILDAATQARENEVLAPATIDNPPTPTATPTPDVSDQRDLIDQLAANIDVRITAAQELQMQLQALDPAQQVSLAVCRIEFPQPPPVNFRGGDSEAHPEIYAFAISSESPFQTVQQDYQTVLDYWDEVVCPGRPLTTEDIDANVQQLTTVINALTDLRNNRLPELGDGYVPPPTTPQDNPAATPEPESATQ
ncbi:MAG: HEAT repeat domain-containing protein [Chloroflexi bacterium]|nr:HEAT repeat domain-containing protein [Chloroflexota bacterium]